MIISGERPPRQEATIHSRRIRIYLDLNSALTRSKTELLDRQTGIVIIFGFGYVPTLIAYMGVSANCHLTHSYFRHGQWYTIKRCGCLKIMSLVKAIIRKNQPWRRRGDQAHDLVRDSVSRRMMADVHRVFWEVSILQR